MITRLSGRLDGIEGQAALVTPAGGGLTYEVLLPAYLLERFKAQTGKPVTFTTLQYLEGQGQGASFVPRLIGFAGAGEREFFELLTTVKGIGNRKALRILAATPAAIAAAVAAKDAKALTKLPEVGKRLAETMIAELHGKVDAYLTEEERGALDAAASGLELKLPAGAAEAVEALVALGEDRREAERRVAGVVKSATGGESLSADEVLGLVYAGR